MTTHQNHALLTKKTKQNLPPLSIHQSDTQKWEITKSINNDTNTWEITKSVM